MKKVYTPRAPEPGGHYEQGVISSGMLYISGQLPVNPVNPEIRITGFREQVLQVLQNIDAVLDAAGASREQVVRTTLYITDIALWPEVNRMYADFFGDHRPARTVVPVKELHYGYKIEMDAVAELLNTGDEL